MKRFLRIAIVMLMLLFASGFFVFTFEQDPGEMLRAWLDNNESGNHLVVLIIAGLTLISTLAGLPVLYLAVVMGFFLPFLPALGFTYLINLLAVIATYGMVRSTFSGYFKEKYGNKNVIKKINKRIRKYGLWTVAMTRAVYFIPTNIINFSFPLSKITFQQYFLGTLIGLVPETLINVLTGYLLKNHLMLLKSAEKDILKIAVPAGALLIIASMLSYLYLRKRRHRKTRLNDIVPPLTKK